VVGQRVIFPAVAAVAFLLPTVAIALLASLVLWLRGQPQRRYWRAVAWIHLGLLPVHLFVTFPALLGWFGSRGLGTRGDERAYQGPRFAEDGSWLLQDRASLAAERDQPVDPAVAAAAAAFAIAVPGADGLRLRAFRVPARQQPPRAVVVLVHGLFRSALELEAPAVMFRRLGCECWLLEQRNHGGSARAPATYGLRESDDLVAVVHFVRSRPELADTPLLLFGVSLGTVATSLALPRLAGVAGVVLDAPIGDLLETAHRMLGLQRRGDRRSFFALCEPWQSLTLASLQLWSGFRLEDVQPARALCGLDNRLPVLLIGGARDDKVPAESVRALYDSLPMPPGTKELWMVADAGHGDAWQKDAGQYERRLANFVARAVAP
jgi:uncharacterized protein